MVLLAIMLDRVIIVKHLTTMLPTSVNFSSGVAGIVVTNKPVFSNEGIGEQVIVSNQGGNSGLED